METRPVVLSLVTCGTPDSPIYKIADQHLRFFDGQAWTTDEAKALLCDHSNSACGMMQKILMLARMEKRVRRFRAPVLIDLPSPAQHRPRHGNRDARNGNRSASR